ncbi:PP2C family protein-serine/threonine phosphatase [Corynebacterium parakroppenstedtii]|uniref:PP2C family protein-serine/threonine phosphatase n=1 Tax=Corynebacterium parakroppenstedtii TaxID=2828363 RepID=UPI001C8CF7F3|nr:protein phosphatase 2C domain-containing protein [Corynebacterium parakroppenstedtii]MBY0789525.1 serine/threonine-protein phosphatase [Corynebacterium parakroppenstedtii]
MTYALTYAAASHVGLIRGNNEDSAYAGPHLLALADGMGGHAAGEIASQLMISHIAHVDDVGPGDDMCGQLADAMAEGNAAIANQIDINPATEGMGCTLDAFFFNDDTLAICHVGDSRGYLYRDGQLEQITKDDTYVQSLVDEGQLAPEDVSNHPQRSLILKALTGRPVEPTLMLRDVRPGDRYLLCSDGLSDPVSHDTIADIVSRGTLDQAAERLIDLALRSGGPDNVTVVLGEIVDTSDDDYAPAAPLLVGALDPEQTDVARPDTAAGRAVGMKLIQQNKEAQAQRNPGARSGSQPASPNNGGGPSDNGRTHTSRGDLADSAHSGTSAGANERSSTAGRGAKDSTDSTHGSAVAGGHGHNHEKHNKKKGRRIGLTVGVIVLILAVVIGAGGWWAKKTLDNRYYIATDNNELVVYKGADETILGKTLHSTYQRACLDAKGNLTLLDANSTKKCHRFQLTDLPPSTRTNVDNLPSGDYNDVQTQMERLAKQALPVCVTRESSHGNADNPDAARDNRSGEPHAPSDAATSGEPAPSAPSAGESAANNASGDTANGQPGDLTTPGDTCREVK